MTAGHDPVDPAAPSAPMPPEHATAETEPLSVDRPGADQPGSVRPAERPGPLPPRMHSTGAFPTVAPPGQLPSGPPPMGYPGGPTTPTSAFPAVPAGYAAPTTAIPTASVSVPPPYGSPAGPYGGPGQAGAAQPGPGHHRPPGGAGRWLGGIALFMCGLLLIVAGVQAYLLSDLGDKLAEEQRTSASARAEADSRVQGLEGRTGNLEKRIIDPEAVAKDVLPSVFVVETEFGLGTAFAVGKDPGGGTDLITNHHVIREAYEGGVREVSLVRDDKRFPVRIVEIDPANDLALLHSDETFPRLAAAKNPAQPGQPVVVVGAPLGLESTVTTGVVSATRQTSRGPLVQYDAASNPGNSGGPVVNAQREVVGVVRSGIREEGAQGLNFAIPIDTVCQAFDIC